MDCVEIRYAIFFFFFEESNPSSINILSLIKIFWFFSFFFCGIFWGRVANWTLQVMLYIVMLQAEVPELRHKDRDGKSSVWQVKSSNDGGSGGGGEIKKIKLCIVRPSETLEPSPRRRKRYEITVCVYVLCVSVVFKRRFLLSSINLTSHTFEVSKFWDTNWYFAELGACEMSHYADIC